MAEAGEGDVRRAYDHVLAGGHLQQAHARAARVVLAAVVFDGRFRILQLDGGDVDDVAPDQQLLVFVLYQICLLYTSPSPRDGLLSRMPSSA